MNILSEFHPILIFSLAFIVGSVLMVLPVSLYHYLKSLYYAKRRKKFDQEEKAKDRAKPIATASGWVIVPLDALDNAEARREILNTRIANLDIPYIAETMIYPINNFLRYEIIRTCRIAINSPEPTDEEERMRGITIGSALFNYPIPESFVRLDKLTKLYYAVYKFNNSERKTFSAWYETHASLFAAVYNSSTEHEEKLGITKEIIVDFYHQHAKEMVTIVLNAVELDAAPPINAVLEHIIVILKIPRNKNNYHLIRLCVSVIVTLAGFAVPASWVFISKMFDKLFEVIAEMERIPSLKLVINNQQHEDKNVW